MRRYELTDEQWKLIEPHLPHLPRQSQGGKWNDHRMVLDGMLWILRAGAPWRDMPERYGKWQSVYARFRRWTRDGTIDRVLKAMRIRLDAQGKIDWDLWCIDGTSVRPSRAAAGAPNKNAKGSLKTTHWAARAADGDQSSTWSLTVAEFPSAPSSRPGRGTSRRSSPKP